MERPEGEVVGDAAAGSSAPRVVELSAGRTVAELGAGGRVPADLRNWIAAGCFVGVATAVAGCLAAWALTDEPPLLLLLANAVPLFASAVLARGAWLVRPHGPEARFAIGLYSVVLAQAIMWLACAAMTARAVVSFAGTESLAEQDLRMVVGGLGVLLNVAALVAVAGLAGLSAGAVRKGWLVAGEIAWLVAGPLFFLSGPFAMS